MGEGADAVDFLVIGGGPGGYTAALRAAQLGRTVTLVDSTGIGGVCLRVGCIPSKMLIEAADAHHLCSQLLAPTTPVADLATWQDQKTKVVGDLAAGISGRLRTAAVEVVSGRARFTSRGRVAVEQPNGQTAFLEFRHCLLATGSRPSVVAGAPVDNDRVLDSTGVLALDVVPQRLVVVGAGYVGVELATAFAKLGADVTIVEMRERLLPELPAILARPVERRLQQLGVELLFEATVTSVTDTTVECRVGDSTKPLPADRVLVAAGRRPNTDDIGLDAARLSVDTSGRLVVGPDRLVAGTTIAAVGDIAPGPMLAHKAAAEAVVGAEALCGRRTAFDSIVPEVVFCDPQVATAGYTTEEAERAGLRARGVSVPLTAVGRAATMGARDGFVQVVADRDRNVVIGVHIVAPHAAELVAEGVLAIELAAEPGDLAASIHPHPTLSEALQEAARRLADDARQDQETDRGRQA